MRRYSAEVSNGIAFVVLVTLLGLAIVNTLQTPSTWTAALAWRAMAVGVVVLGWVLIVKVGDRLQERAEKPTELAAARARRADRADRVDRMDKAA